MENIYIVKLFGQRTAASLRPASNLESPRFVKKSVVRSVLYRKKNQYPVPRRARMMTMGRTIFNVRFITQLQSAEIKAEAAEPSHSDCYYTLFRKRCQDRQFSADRCCMCQAIIGKVSFQRKPVY